MNKYSVFSICLSCVLTFGSGLCAAGENEIPLYVGRRVCTGCHSAGTQSRPCSLESIPKHDRSFMALAKPEAADIAVLSGVTGPPQQSRICLGCHATASDVGGRWTAYSFDITRGVQCESCHGPGSLHVEWADCRPARHQRNQLRIHPGDRQECVTCHWPRASHREVLQFGYRTPEVDKQYKTPVNLALSPDGSRLYVVCEQSGTLAVVDKRTRSVLREIAVGRLPHGVAVGPNGKTVYVTNRFDDSLSVIDAETLQVTRTVPVGSEPHGVVTDAAGAYLYVANTGQDSVSVIHAGTLKEEKRLAAGRGPWALALQPDGRSIFVTNVRPNRSRFRSPVMSEITVIDTTRRIVIERPQAVDASFLQGIAAAGRGGLAIFTMMRVKNLVPITRGAQGWTVTHGLGVIQPDDGKPLSGRIDQLLLDAPNAHLADLNDVAVSPDGRFALVTSGGLDLVAVVDIEKMLETISSATAKERREVLPNHLGLSSRFVIKQIPVGHNPRGMIYDPDGTHAYVADALSDSIAVIDTTDFTVAAPITLGGPATVSQTRRGARIFHSAKHTFGHQFSCHTCHPDAHINGLAFDIEADGIGVNPVDNRTLRGIFDTAPFKWEGTNPSLSRQCGPRFAIFFTRLEPYNPSELAALVQFLRTVPRPPNRYRQPEGLTLAQRRGKDIFERTKTDSGPEIPPAKRCITCHSSPYRSNQSLVDVGTTMWLDFPVPTMIQDLHDPKATGDLGVVYFHDTAAPKKKFNVAHLTNVYNSAPYLHNGSARTLEEIWTRFNLYNDHGMTGDLTRRQFNDLIAYVKSL